MDINNYLDPLVLTKWQDTQTEVDDTTVQELDCITGTSPFPFDPSLNRRIVYWIGNIWQLKADAIVCCENEESKADLITKHTILRAGKELDQEHKDFSKKFKNGEVRITKGYNLPCSFIIHTLAPRYSGKYFTAAEIALHNAYRSVLLAAEENRFKTLGVRCIHSSVCKYPSFSGAHVALRTVRRFLERHSSIELVVLVVSNHNKEAYDSLLPLYFPRNEKEERLAALMLPSNTGDQNGQLFLPERQIRITSRPAKLVVSTEPIGDGQEIVSKSTSNISYDHNESQLHCIDQAFMTARESVDKERVRRIVMGEDPQNQASIRKSLYKRLLIRARKEDFEKLLEKRFLYQAGKDRRGTAIVVFLAERFVGDTFHPCTPSHPHSRQETKTLREKLQLFFIQQMDSIANDKYSFLCVQTPGGKNQLSSECLNSLFGMLDSKYISNLEDLFILHSTTLLSRWSTLYRHPSSLNRKTTFLKGIEHLWTFVSPDQLNLPETVLANDLKLYGVRYYPG